MLGFCFVLFFFVPFSFIIFRHFHHFICVCVCVCVCVFDLVLLFFGFVISSGAGHYRVEVWHGLRFLMDRAWFCHKREETGTRNQEGKDGHQGLLWDGGRGLEEVEEVEEADEVNGNFLLASPPFQLPFSSPSSSTPYLSLSLYFSLRVSHPDGATGRQWIHLGSSSRQWPIHQQSAVQYFRKKERQTDREAQTERKRANGRESSTPTTQQ